MAWKKPFTWSPSRVEQFEVCGKRYFLVQVAKKYSDTSEAMDWGSSVHKAAEARVRDGAVLPMGMEQFEKTIAEVAGIEGTVYTERKLAINRNLEPVDWMANDVWGRVVIDCAKVQEQNRIALLVDWKTGRPKQETLQLDCMALAMFVHSPRLLGVKAQFAWLQQKALSEPVYYRRDKLPELVNKVLPRIQRMEAAHDNDEYPARPGGLCRKWCPVKECAYHGQ